MHGLDSIPDVLGEAMMRLVQFNSVLIALYFISLNTFAAEPPFPGAPNGAAAFSPMIGDHSCTMTYRGEDGELTVKSDCRWHWYYKFEGHMVQDDFYMLDDAGKVIWTGSTLRTWEPSADRWNNMFLGSHGTGFGRMFHGKPVEDEVHLEVDDEDPDGTPHKNRIYFYEVEAGKFRWRQERSDENGENWKVWVTVDINGPMAQTE